MPDVKVALIGAGSYVFGAGVLKQALAEHRLGAVELALMDVDSRTLELMAGVGRRVAADLGLPTRIRTYADRDAALDGADFVLCSVAQELRRRCEIDAAIVRRLAPGHWVTEFGGVAGISYSLRQIAFITDLAESMNRLCPGVWLLTSSNPLPRVCQAAAENGVRTAGFCSVATGGLGRLWRLLRGRDLAFPCTEADEAFEVTMAGLNHFSWLTEIRDRATGQDLLPALRRRLGETDDGTSRSVALARGTGYLPMGGDSHIRDFLEPQGPAPSHGLHHGTDQERRERLALLQDVAEGRAAWEPLFEHTCWERPIDLVAAMAFGKDAYFHSLNLPNAGQVPNLPGNVFVETPCTADANGPVPRAVALPDSILPYCRRTAEVTDAIVRAAGRRSRKLVHEAVELDPTIADKAAGRRAIDACLEAHADLTGPYGP